MTKKTKEKLFKSEALGTVSEKRLKADFNYKVSLEKLNQPLNEEAGLILFCLGCGSYHQIQKIHIKELESFLKKKIPSSEYYYETSSCVLCDSTVKKVELKKIADLEK